MTGVNVPNRVTLISFAFSILVVLYLDINSIKNEKRDYLVVF